MDISDILFLIILISSQSTELLDFRRLTILKQFFSRDTPPNIIQMEKGTHTLPAMCPLAHFLKDPSYWVGLLPHMAHGCVLKRLHKGLFVGCSC